MCSVFMPSINGTWQFPKNTVQVLVLDAGAVPVGFHDVVIEICRTLQSFVTRRDFTSLQRRWLSKLFAKMHGYQVEMEALHGTVSGNLIVSSRAVAQELVMSNLSRHAMDIHLRLAQLWRCPVGWCSVWKGTAQDCMDHLRDRHEVSSSVSIRKLGKYFPPWTVTHRIWLAALCKDMSDFATDVLLFHMYGRRLVHRYRIFKDPLPHVSLREAVIRDLVCFASRAMAVAQLTNLNMSIPVPVPAPAPCLPVNRTTGQKAVSFASNVEVSAAAMIRSNRLVAPVSPDVLHPSWELSLPIPPGYDNASKTECITCI